MNDASIMTMKDFEDHLDRLGSNLDLWPVPDARAALGLLAASAEARQTLEAVTRMDRSIGALAATAQHHAARPARKAPQPRRNAKRMAAWGSALLAASLVIGFIAGNALSYPDDDVYAPPMASAADAGDFS